VPQLSEKPELHAVEEALEDTRWDFRTIEGLAADLEVEPNAVREIFQSHPEIVRKSVLTDRHGRHLYTAHGRPLKLAERLERFRSVL